MTRSDFHRSDESDVYLLHEKCFIIQGDSYKEMRTKNKKIGHKGAVNDQEGD